MRPSRAVGQINAPASSDRREPVEIERHFEEQAARCRRLAANSTDLRMSESLTRLSEEYLARAVRAAAESTRNRHRASPEPLAATAIEGEVVMMSDAAAARALTPAAARETALRLIEAAAQAERPAE